jgi:hypothetical protein
MSRHPLFLNLASGAHSGTGVLCLPLWPEGTAAPAAASIVHVDVTLAKLVGFGFDPRDALVGLLTVTDYRTPRSRAQDARCESRSTCEGRTPRRRRRGAPPGRRARAERSPRYRGLIGEAPCPPTK